MIIYGTILIGLLFSIFLFIKFRKQVVWWEYLLLIAIPIGLTFASKAIIEKSQVTFTEYWGSYVISVYEEEPWNEWIEKTYSREYACGTDSKGNTKYCTEYYDCSYQEDYGPKWYCETNIGETISITQEQYDKWSKSYGNKRSVKTRINHSPRDKAYYSNGTKFEGTRVGKNSYVYKSDFKERYENLIPVTSKHSYENRIKASDYTVFNYMKVTQEEKDSLKLYNYPNMSSSFYYPTILGCYDNDIQHLFRKINGKLGSSKQVRLWILLFESDDSNIGWMQENYWVGGNKNELVINIGYSKGKISWCHVFSWSNSQGLKDNIKHYVENKETFTKQDWKDFSVFLFKNIEQDWKRLEFTQFDYLTVEPPTWAIIVTYIIVLIVSLVISFFVVNNNFSYEDENKKYNNRYHGKY